MAMNRTTFQDLTGVSQALREIYNQEFKDPDVDISQVFNVVLSTSAEEKDLTTFGIDDLQDVGEGGETPYGEPGEGYSTTYAHKTYKGGLVVTEEMLDDDQYRFIVQRTKMIAKAARYTPLAYAMKFFQNAFTANPAGYGNYNGGTLALCSSAQTYEDGSSGTQSNYTTLKLTYDNFDAGIEALYTQKTTEGRLLSWTGKPKLVVGPHRKKTAIEITDSELDPSTANNAINVYKGATADVVVNPWLSTAGGSSAYQEYWFLIAPDSKLNFFWRKKPVYLTDVDTDNHTIKSNVRARWSAGASDWRGFYGSTGSA